jgi:hypothetical protein
MHTLKQLDLEPGEQVSIDQYVSGVPGRQPETKGREPPSKRFNGGTIFVDHATSYVYIHHQILLRGGETLQAKRAFEQLVLSHGATVKAYHADNAPFGFPEFKQDVLNKQQTITYSGVGAHHQIGVAENAIRMITSWARAMLLHSFLHWPGEAKLDLWPFAMQHAAYLWNHLPCKDTGLAPVELLSQCSFTNYHHLQ